MDKIHVFRPIYRIDECLAEIRECLEIGWTGLGYKTLEFEEAWKAYSNLPNAHMTNSATAGLDMAVAILKETYGWKAGDEIISTPLTFVSTNHAIIRNGMQVKFADVDDYLCLDLESVEKRRTDKTRAVMFVGIGGNDGQFQKIAAWAKANNILVILDAAHMAGTRRNCSQVGKEADVVVFSFQAVKNLPTADAGMICFADGELDALARQWSWLGISKDTYARTSEKGAYKWHYEVDHLGGKYHGNSIMAALGLVGLRHLDEQNAYRRQLARWYDKFLPVYVQKIKETPGCESSRHLYQIVVEDRDEVMMALNQNGIYPGVHYRINTDYSMYHHDRVERMRISTALGETVYELADPCPQARWYSERIISLPVHLQIGYEDVKFICEAVESCVN